MSAIFVNCWLHLMYVVQRPHLGKPLAYFGDFRIAQFSVLSNKPIVYMHTLQKDLICPWASSWSLFWLFYASVPVNVGSACVILSDTVSHNRGPHVYIKILGLPLLKF